MVSFPFKAKRSQVYSWFNPDLRTKEYDLYGDAYETTQTPYEELRKNWADLPG
jgi:hypothetical protein